MVQKIGACSILLIMVLSTVCCGNKGVKQQQNEEFNRTPSIKDLNKTPEVYVDSLVMIEGTLVNQGEDYFKDLRLVLKDENGNVIPVPAWVPIEIPPVQHPDIPKPKILHDYLEKKIEAKGYLRHDPNRFKGYPYFFNIIKAEIIEEE